MPSKKDEEPEPEHNPLGFLDRLLEDERHSNLHFGDVRFWQHLEYVDTAQIYRTKSLEYRTMKMMFCEAVFYALFLFVLTGFIVEQRSSSLYDARRQQLDYWAGCRRSSDGQDCELHRVKDRSSLMEWLRDGFVPKVFTHVDQYLSLANFTAIGQDAATMAWTPRYDSDTKTSVIVGAIRLRQLRVQDNNQNCRIPESWEEIHSDCFPKFSAGIQSKATWAPTWTPDYLQGHYVWHSARTTEQTPMIGLAGTYPGDGFYLDIPLNKTGARDRLRELEEWQWLDEQTRAFIIEVSTLNPNVNVFVHNRILVEFPATSGVLVRHDAFAFRTLQLSLSLMATDDFRGVFTYFTLTTAMHLMLGAYVCFLVWKNGLRFFAFFWSICDLIILFLFSILIIVYVNVFVQAGYEKNLQPEVIADPEVFFPIGRLVPPLEFMESVLAALGLVSWFKILKYFSLVGMFHAFVRVVERCIFKLLLFACLLFVVLLGFAVALHAAYGDEKDLFSTLGGAFLAIVVLPAGGVDLDPIFNKDDMLGPVLVFTYIIVVFLILLNTFMAICVDTYSVCTYEINEVMRVKRDNATAVFLWTYFNALKGTKLVGKESEDEKGRADEQNIPLSSLPEALSSRYLETRKKMIALLDTAEAEMEEEKLMTLRETGVIQDAPPTQPQAPPPGTRPATGATGSKTLALQDQPKMLALRDANGRASGTLGRQRPPAIDMKASTTDGMGGSMQQLPAPDSSSITVNRVQLQRMLDDDEVLRQICGTGRSIDVVRRFRVDHSGVDPYEAVARLQATVARKLEEIEDAGMNLTFDEVDTLKTVSQELHSSLTESQKEWREELLSVLQMSSLLSVALIDLTKKLELVQINHNALAAKVRH